MVVQQPLLIVSVVQQTVCSQAAQLATLVPARSKCAKINAHVLYIIDTAEMHTNAGVFMTAYLQWTLVTRTPA